MRGNVLLEAAGGLRECYEEVNWAATPLGPVASWSPALRDALDVTLNTQFPVTLFWGPAFVLLYNEAYVPLIADKHPAALGRPAREVFPEAWATIGPMMEGVLAGEGANWVEDAYVPLVRRGRLEEAHFTFSYSPVRDEDGRIEGVMNIATETTRQVIDRRRLELLNGLRDLLDGLDRVEDVVELALPLLRVDVQDLPGVEIQPADPADGAHAVVERSGTSCWARLPLGSDLVLVVRLSEHLAPDEEYLGFLRLVATAIGHAIVRIRAREAEHGMSEALQRTLLAMPPQAPTTEIAVRYLPAGALARVGGDWYDAFVGPDGTLTVAVGDVAGHDRWAAAAMAQVRNLLRGVAYSGDRTPARVLAGLDSAMTGLGVGVYATAVVAQVPPGERTLRWSNAGHPPPVIVAAGGGARLMETEPDVLLGLGGGTAERQDHSLALAPGDAVLFYTDGLVEQRPIPLQERLTWLTGLLADCGGMAAEAICDHVLSQLEGPVDDDVALLVLRP